MVTYFKFLNSNPDAWISLLRNETGSVVMGPLGLVVMKPETLNPKP